ncbi:19773_t:CDS:1, partial [Racocetra persica]
SDLVINKENYDGELAREHEEWTEQEISKGNHHLYVSDYANEVSKDEFFSERSGRSLTAYGLTF